MKELLKLTAVKSPAINGICEEFYTLVYDNVPIGKPVNYGTSLIVLDWFNSITQYEINLMHGDIVE